MELLETGSEADPRDLRLCHRSEKEGEGVAVNAPVRLIDLSLLSYLSGNSAHTATLKKEGPRIHRIQGP
jgi:hypothetical protein